MAESDEGRSLVHLHGSGPGIEGDRLYFVVLPDAFRRARSGPRLLLTRIDRSDTTSRLGEPQAASFVASVIKSLCTLGFEDGEILPSNETSGSLALIVSIVDGSCFVYREPTDPKFRPNRSRSSWSPPGWYGAESRLLYNVQKILNARGYGLLKKRMWRDGHMFGTEHSQYLRSHDIEAVPSLFLYHSASALEVLAESFNQLGRVELDVMYGAGWADDRNFESRTREWVVEAEPQHPCYEFSWEAEATLDGHNGVRRLYRGFTNLDEARAFMATDPGDSCRLIDRRTGERVSASCFA